MRRLSRPSIKHEVGFKYENNPAQSGKLFSNNGLTMPTLPCAGLNLPFTDEILLKFSAISATPFGPYTLYSLYAVSIY